jgi:hypothetical protein
MVEYKILDLIPLMDTKAKQPKKYSYNEKIFKRAKNDTPIII